MGNFITALLTMVSSIFSLQQNSSFQSLNVDEFESLLKKDNIQLVDVRTPNEYSEGHIANSINIDVLSGGFDTKANQALSKDKPVAVYCRSGQRSKRAANILAKEGYQVYELNNGIIGWSEANKAIEK